MFDLIRSKLESDYVGHPNLMDCGNEQGMQRDWPEGSEKLTLTVQMPHTVLLEINCLQRSHRGYAKEFTSFLKTVNAPALLGGCFHKFVRESVFKLYNFPRGCSNLFQW